MTPVLVRLYPRAWRDRYGAEFAALLEQLPTDPSVLVDTVVGAVRAHLTLSAPRDAGGDPMPVISLDVRDRLGHKRSLGALAALVLFPAAVFLVVSLLKYVAGVAGPFDALQPIYRAGKPVELATFLAPFVAFLLAVLPIAGFRVERGGATLRATLELDGRALNVTVAVVSTAVATAFAAYLLGENALAR